MFIASWKHLKQSKMLKRLEKEKNQQKKAVAKKQEKTEELIKELAEKIVLPEKAIKQIRKEALASQDEHNMDCRDLNEVQDFAITQVETVIMLLNML